MLQSTLLDGRGAARCLDCQSNERMIEMNLRIVAELENPVWQAGQPAMDNVIIFARDGDDLYVCYIDDFGKDEGAKWNSNDLQEALEHYRQYHKGWRAWVYE